MNSSDVHTLSTGLLQRSTGRNSWHSDKTTRNQSEYGACGLRQLSVFVCVEY